MLLPANIWLKEESFKATPKSVRGLCSVAQKLLQLAALICHSAIDRLGETKSLAHSGYRSVITLHWRKKQMFAKRGRSNSYNFSCAESAFQWLCDELDQQINWYSDRIIVRCISLWHKKKNVYAWILLVLAFQEKNGIWNWRKVPK